MTFKYIDEHENTIFLHFLNREAHEACGSQADYDEAWRALETLCISHYSGMTVNISQLLEFSDDNTAFLRKVFELHRAGIIDMISQAHSAQEFISSRQSLYEHDQKRYPMYFGENVFVLEKFKFDIPNTVSTTEVLFREILNWKPGQIVGAINESLTEADRQAIVRRADQIQKITMREQGRAVTRALYKAREKEENFSRQELDVIARMISGVYISGYKRKGGYTTCSGVSFVQYYDNFQEFPYYDITLLGRALAALGLDRVRHVGEAALQKQVIALYDSTIHNDFVANFNTLLGCICGIRVVNGDNVTAIRRRVINVLKKAVAEAAKVPDSFNNLQHFYEASISNINLINLYLASKSTNFAEALSTFIKVRSNMKKILILTATQKEDDELTTALSEEGFSLGRPRRVGRNMARTFTSALPIELLHLRSSAGSGGSNGSTLVTAEAISILAPDHVLSVGICFGTDEKDQKIGDITVSKEIFHYDPARFKGDDYISRGQKLPSSELLLSACQQIRLDNVNIHYGLVASGEKLVDDKEFVEFLKTQQKEIIAGEMEGTGISSACQRERTDWIMVKAICDWGYDKTKEYQAAAARNSARFAIRVIKLIADLET